MKVRPFARILGIAGGADPVNRLPARVGRLDDALGLVTPTQARDLEALELVIWNVRNIDVEQCRVPERIVSMFFDKTACYPRRIRIVPALLARERNGDGRDAQQKTLHGRSHRPRVNRIVTHIGTVIDSRYDHVRQLVEQTGHGKVHTVGRCTVYIEESAMGTLDDQRSVKR